MSAASTPHNRGLFRSHNRKFRVARTIRCELKPYNEATNKHLKWEATTLEETLFGKEVQRANAREVIKQQWNRLIDEFLQAFFEEATIPPALLEQAWNAYHALQESAATSDREKQQQALEAAMLAIYNHLRAQLQSFRDPATGLTFKELTEKKAYQVLLHRAVEEHNNELKEAIETFGPQMFSKLHDLVRNRIHNLGAGAKKVSALRQLRTSGNVLARVAPENLSRFLRNRWIYEAKLKGAIPLSPEEEEIFSLNYFNRTLSQRGIDEYNRYLGGEEGAAGQERKAGINNRINEYNQRHTKTDHRARLPLLSPLYRQVLADRQRSRHQGIASDDELIALLEEALTKGERFASEARRFWERWFHTLAPAAHNEETYDLSRVPIAHQGARSVAQEVLSEWAALDEVFLKPTSKRDCESGDTYACLALGRRKERRFDPFRSVQALLRWMEHAADTGTLRSVKTGASLSFEDFLDQWRSNVFARFDGGEIRSATAERAKQHFVSFDELARDARAQLTAFTQYRAQHGGRRPAGEQWREMKAAWRAYLDALVEVARLFRLFPRPDEIPQLPVDEAFASDLASVIPASEEHPSTFLAAVRNYLTKKEVRPDEVRVYFSPQFLDNWSYTRVSAGHGAFFRSPHGEFVLGIELQSGILEKFYQRAAKKTGGEGEEWVIYRFQQAAGIGKNAPNLFLQHDGSVIRKTGKKDADNVNRELERIRNEMLPPEINDVRKEVGYSSECTRERVGDERFDAFIRYYQQCIERFYGPKGLSFQWRESYDSWQEFVQHADEQAMEWQAIPLATTVVQHAVEEGKLLLFRVCNRDLCAKHPRQGSRENIHTLILRAFFSEENTTHRPLRIRLGAEAKIFMRRAQKGEKKPKEGITLPDGSPIYEHNRFFERKLLFHLPLFINADLPEVNRATFNREVRTTLFPHARAVIGVDRGERNLLSYAIVSREGRGRVIDAGSLNVIGSTDYQALLRQRERERQEARRAWEEVGNITDLKAGYLSHVIHAMVQHALDYDAPIALENLNFRFKQKRGGQFERSVYQQFEHALLTKLELVVEKERQDTPYAAVTEASQLATVGSGSQAVSFKDLSGQHGIVLFVPAAYTSTTCPHCGWRHDWHLKYQLDAPTTLAHIAQRLISFQLSSGGLTIAYRREHDGSPVHLTASVDRVWYDSTKRTYLIARTPELSDALVRIFTDGAEASTLIGFESAVAGFRFSLDELKAGIPGDALVDREVDSTTVKALVFFLNRILRMRSTTTPTDEETETIDFVQCPRCGFDSRRAPEYASHPDPAIRHLAHLTDGDVVGAFNIARKAFLDLEPSEEKKRKGERHHLHEWDKMVYCPNDELVLLTT